METPPGRRPWVLDVRDATDVALCGGKGVGLCRLRRAGFTVPPAICLTTECYRDWAAACGLAPLLTDVLADPGLDDDPERRRQLLRRLREHVEAAPVPAAVAGALEAAVGGLRQGAGDGLAVRSSAPWEDDADASHAGIHASFVVGAQEIGAVEAAVNACWSSLWTETAWMYRTRLRIPHAAAAMAVIIQRFVAAERAGVAFSADPLTGDPTTVVIDAGWGSGAALVAGRLTPDEYRVALGGGGFPEVRRRPGRQQRMAAWCAGQELALPVPAQWRQRPVLSEGEAVEVARLARRAEEALQAPADIEWVAAGGVFWVVQARPITTLDMPRALASAPGTVWTRANLKEILPELPSPLALSYLSATMNRMFIAYHAAQGYALPPGARLVSVFRGRPYLNLTLMRQMTAVRGGNPAIVGRLFGGPGATQRPEPSAAPDVARAGERRRLGREMLATLFRTPRSGRRLFRRLRREAAALRAVRLERLDERALGVHLDRFRARLADAGTIRALHEVVSAQSRAYMALETLLGAWAPDAAGGLVTRLMTGLGTLPNVRMAYALMALAGTAAREDRARAFLADERSEASLGEYRSALAGTRFLAELDRFLAEFGHRGRYESDVMSPRFEEDPVSVLRLARLHVRAGRIEDPARHAAERRRVRQAARADVRRALRRGRGRLAFAVRWTVFSIVCDALQRLLALRDECRHVTTMLVAHLRRVALEIGRRAAREGALASPDDVFFLTWDELPRVRREPDRDWRGLALRRRTERDRQARLAAPDLLGGSPAGTAGAPVEPVVDELGGLGVSPGTVTGTVKVLRSLDEAGRLSGEIGVFPTIEPALTPLFPLLGGVVAEMGGLLSHAAILAREYGLPAVVNVQDATRHLRDGDRVTLDGTTGRVRVLQRRAA